jgi:D-inositol-3-phosphate glycosyltransferase
VNFLRERLNGMRWRLRATRRLWSRGADPSSTFLAPELPEPQPMGEIDSPESGSVDPRAALNVSGWVLFPDAVTARVEVLLDGHSLGHARLGLVRQDVAQSWDPPHAVAAGFQLSADLAGLHGAGDTTLVAVATSVNGESYQLGPVPLRLERKREDRTHEMPPPAPRTAAAPSAHGPHVLVYTHQLNLGGAQLYLLDLLRELVRRGQMSFTMVSAMDGPLRKDLEALGIPVHISSFVPPDDLSSHIGRIEELVAWAEPREFDVAFVNTATALSLPGAEAAEQLGIPVVWAIHESLTPSVLWSDFDPAVRDRAEKAIAGSSALVFEAEATQRLLEPITGQARCLTLPYGLDLEPIDAHRAGFNRLAARRKAGVPHDAELAICVGTVEPRKAQLLLAQAFDRISESHPSARIAFVGGRDDLESEALVRFIELSGVTDRMELIPITPDVERWYGMADILVCASDVESLPRTVLEAMAWETPVLATDVFGLPELITHGETGWLCEPRDLIGLSKALDQAFGSTQEERKRIGRASRALVEDRHSLQRYGGEIAGLLVSASKKTPSPAPDAAAT